ncbi:HGL054Cp [Eremothecium sinecaudum]|uniref:HGL054Cp n=1 Tax=Eremothecium sinecaudum TaxID=45286 RepID=A0A0X8HV31_9SACH|nr:HGL054Cp [Eremothecium sinecaudum]AMD22286.1 HGL054Cp [Eremothecium sinecaudum]
MVAKSDITPLHSVLAGSVAGAIEGTITYPFEFAKTRLQLAEKKAGASRNPLVLIYSTVRNQGLSALYVGCPAFVVGNTAKAGIRFLGYDTLKNLLKEPETGKLSGISSIAAGIGAGLFESIFAVTPFEAIKTALIDDRQAKVPKYQNNGRLFLFNYTSLVSDLGLRGIYSGLVPVALRQMANQAVRFGCYNKIQNAVKEYTNTPPTKSLSVVNTFVAGSISGVVTVYATMPIDTIKTRMQSLSASQYSSTLDCFVTVVRDEGVKTLWKGATPRLGRLILSGGIVFTTYEQIIKLLSKN